MPCLVGEITKFPGGGPPDPPDTNELSCSFQNLLYAGTLSALCIQHVRHPRPLYALSAVFFKSQFNPCSRVYRLQMAHKLHWLHRFHRLHWLHIVHRLQWLNHANSLYRVHRLQWPSQDLQRKVSCTICRLELCTTASSMFYQQPAWLLLGRLLFLLLTC